MRLPIRQTKTPANRRLLAGLGALVVFGALFIVPLWVALTLCTMPCCSGDDDATGPVVSAGMAACATECGIRSAAATPAKIVTLAARDGMHRSSPVAIAVAHLPAVPAAPVACDRVEESSHRGAGTSLQVLNSVFRI
jgi:hypothetical protein